MKLLFANVRTISELVVLEMGLGNGICDIWKRGKWVEHWGTGRNRGTWNCQSSELSGGGFDWNPRACDGCFFTSGLWLGGQTYAGCVRLMVNPLLLGDVNRLPHPPPPPRVGQLNGGNFIKAATHGGGTVRLIQPYSRGLCPKLFLLSLHMGLALLT